jgi:hypothetical protein
VRLTLLLKLRWLAVTLKQGKKIEDFAIAGSAAKVAKPGRFKNLLTAAPGPFLPTVRLARCPQLMLWTGAPGDRQEETVEVRHGEGVANHTGPE